MADEKFLPPPATQDDKENRDPTITIPRGDTTPAAHSPPTPRKPPALPATPCRLQTQDHVPQQPQPQHQQDEAIAPPTPTSALHKHFLHLTRDDASPTRPYSPVSIATRPSTPNQNVSRPGTPGKRTPGNGRKSPVKEDLWLGKGAFYYSCEVPGWKVSPVGRGTSGKRGRGTPTKGSALKGGMLREESPTKSRTPGKGGTQTPSKTVGTPNRIKGLETMERGGCTPSRRAGALARDATSPTRAVDARTTPTKSNQRILTTTRLSHAALSPRARDPPLHLFTPSPISTTKSAPRVGATTLISHSTLAITPIDILTIPSSAANTELGMSSGNAHPSKKDSRRRSTAENIGQLMAGLSMNSDRRTSALGVVGREGEKIRGSRPVTGDPLQEVYQKTQELVFAPAQEADLMAGSDIADTQSTADVSTGGLAQFAAQPVESAATKPRPIKDDKHRKIGGKTPRRPLRRTGTDPEVILAMQKEMDDVRRSVGSLVGGVIGEGVANGREGKDVSTKVVPGKNDTGLDQGIFDTSNKGDTGEDRDTSAREKTAVVSTPKPRPVPIKPGANSRLRVNTGGTQHKTDVTSKPRPQWGSTKKDLKPWSIATKPSTPSRIVRPPPTPSRLQTPRLAPRSQPSATPKTLPSKMTIPTPSQTPRKPPFNSATTPSRSPLTKPRPDSQKAPTTTPHVAKLQTKIPSTDSRPSQQKFASAGEIADRVHHWNTEETPKKRPIPHSRPVTKVPATPIRAPAVAPRTVATPKTRTAPIEDTQVSHTPEGSPPKPSTPRRKPLNRPVVSGLRTPKALNKTPVPGRQFRDKVVKGEKGALRTPSKAVAESLDRAIDEKIEADKRAWGF